MKLRVPYEISEKELEGILFMEHASAILLKIPEVDKFVAKPVLLNRQHVKSCMSLMQQVGGYMSNYAAVEFPIIVDLNGFTQRSLVEFKRELVKKHNSVYTEITVDGILDSLLVNAQKYGLLSVVLADIDPRLVNESNVLTVKPRLGYSQNMQCYIS